MLAAGAFATVTVPRKFFPFPAGSEKLNLPVLAKVQLASLPAEA
jgi:hypothetical protein